MLHTNFVLMAFLSQDFKLSINRIRMKEGVPQIQGSK